MRDEDSHELREEAKQERYEQRYTPWIDPHDPDYIGEESELDAFRCGHCSKKHESCRCGEDEEDAT